MCELCCAPAKLFCEARVLEVLGKVAWRACEGLRGRVLGKLSSLAPPCEADVLCAREGCVGKLAKVCGGSLGGVSGKLARRACEPCREACDGCEAWEAYEATLRGKLTRQPCEACKADVPVQLGSFAYSCKLACVLAELA